MESVIRRYFECWIKKDAEPFADIFSKDIIYVECYGPEYHGVEQVVKWFDDWNKKGTVLKWDIKQMFSYKNTVVVEWFFQCDYCNEIDSFDGITLAVYNSNNKICSLKEYQSKSEHYCPYG